MSLAVLALGVGAAALLSRRRGRAAPGASAQLGRWRWGGSSLEKRATLDPRLQAFVDELLAVSDVDLTILVGARTNEEQAALYAQGRTAPGNIVTYKKPGQSLHNARPSKAVDLAPLINGKVSWDEREYQRFGPMLDRVNATLLSRGILKKGERIGWGGRWKTFKDWVHFQVEG